jgi:hypothetical protein
VGVESLGDEGHGNRRDADEAPFLLIVLDPAPR